MYANVGTIFPFAVYNRQESGFIGFDFHPEFARNGLFYTVHAERAMGNPATPNFIPPGFTAADITFHNIITEWHAANPAFSTFEGTRRELLRVAGATVVRADLHISRSRDGELFITSRQDGMIRMLVPDSPGAGAPTAR